MTIRLPAPSLVTARLSSPWQLGQPVEQPITLRGASDADVVVVGGGMAGLSAAYHLHRRDPNRRIVLLEAVTVGSGSSGRSTGILAPAIGGPITVLRRRYGDTVARAMYAETLACVRRGLDLVEEADLDAALVRGSQSIVALTPAQARSLHEQAAAFADLGFDVPSLDPAALAGFVRSPRYTGALQHRVSATVDPFRLCRSLRSRLIGAGVEVYELSPVVELAAGDPVVLRTPAGRLRAAQVVLATDSHPPQTRSLGAAVTSLVGHVIRTAPLNDAQFEAVGLAAGDSIVDVRSFFDYYRLTADRRLVLGGAPVAVPSVGDQRHTAASRPTSVRAWDRLSTELGRLFPAAGPIPVTDRWSGRMGSTLDRLPVVGALPELPGVWYAGAWCGHGLALSIGSGARLARLLAGEEAPLALPWLRGSSPSLPPRPVRTLGLRAYVRGLDVLDQVRTRAAA